MMENEAKQKRQKSLSFFAFFASPLKK